LGAVTVPAVLCTDFRPLRRRLQPLPLFPPSTDNAPAAVHATHGTRGSLVRGKGCKAAICQA
jgi:hypothetical protein